VAGFRHERALLRRGYRRIAGVDEVGRGALFGPVVAAAVILPEAWVTGRPPAWAQKIDDSKLLSATKRMELALRILREAEAVGFGFALPSEIDDMNIFKASALAMVRAVGNLCVEPDCLLVDGFELKDVKYAQMALVKGDRKSKSIAAASVAAKVLRDGIIESMDGLYRGYGLTRNKGYGTRSHYAALKEKGPTCLHRWTFKLSGKA